MMRLQFLGRKYTVTQVTLLSDVAHVYFIDESHQTKMVQMSESEFNKAVTFVHQEPLRTRICDFCGTMNDRDPQCAVCGHTQFVFPIEE